MQKTWRQKAWTARTCIVAALYISLSALSAPIRAESLVVLGDSLSAAYGLAADEGWVHRLQRTLAENYPQYKVINASISGATTDAGLQRLPRLLSDHQPDILVLQLGANDGLQGKPVVRTRQNLQKLIDIGKDSGAEVVLLGIRLPPNLGSRYTEPFFAMYGQLAKKNDLALVPFLLDGVAGNAALMQSDGLHPRAEAGDRIFNNIWPTLEAVIQAQGQQPASTESR